LLKIEEVDRGEILSLSKTYGISTIVSDLLSYLDTEGEERANRLPTWSEFRELADKYEVAV